jgi:hypothetical protein
MTLKIVQAISKTRNSRSNHNMPCDCLLANPLPNYQRNNCLKILTGYYCDEDGMGHFIYSTKLVVVVLMLMNISRKMICHSEGRS